MSVDRQFTPQGLEYARRGVPLARAGLTPIDDPDAWELFAEHPGGFRHAWRHRATGWLSQTLTVPQWALDNPPAAQAWANGVGP